MLEKKFRSELGKEIYNLATELNRLKKDKPNRKDKSYELWKQTYEEVKRRLHGSRAALNSLNKPSDNSGAESYNYWFHIAAEEYLPKKVARNIHELTIELMQNQQE